MAIINEYTDKFNNKLYRGCRLKFDNESYYTAELNAKGEFILIPDESSKITLRGKYIPVGFQFTSAKIISYPEDTYRC